jgi:hypothetical protein
MIPELIGESVVLAVGCAPKLHILLHSLKRTLAAVWVLLRSLVALIA